jgi:hypothetical protein
MNWESAEIQGMTMKYARNNVWRFKGELDFDDLMQEFALVHMQVTERADASRGDSAFMALYKTALGWRLTDMIRLHVGKLKCASKVHCGGVSDEDEIDGFVSMMGVSDEHTRENAEIALALDEAPAGIREYVEAKLTGTLKQMLPTGVVETTHEAIKRLTGVCASTFYTRLRAWGEASLGLEPLVRD